jgi:uncharacterized protein (DUF1330 family)
MPAYFVYICQRVIDREALEICWSKIGPTLQGYEARNVAAYSPFQQLEGEKVDGVAEIEFPSIAIAKTWYDSPAYRILLRNSGVAPPASAFRFNARLVRPSAR